LLKALRIFDRVVVLQGHNPAKPAAKGKGFILAASKHERVETGFFSGLLADTVKAIKPDGIIRGLRNGYDLEYEINNQYWNEDLGVTVPFVYFITDRKYGHISRTAIRELQSLNPLRSSS
jgi:pantetheine-phosphate adenylyltransferase